MQPLTALGAATAFGAVIGPVRIAERFDLALASLATRRGRDDDLAKAAIAAGVPLPPPSQAATGSPFGAFWLAPDQWMIEAPLASHEDITAHLKPLFGDAASLTEQTDAWVRFDLSGENLWPLFERLTNLDLQALPDGFAARTVIEHIGCYLIRRTPREVVLYGPRSSARSLLHALQEAAGSLA